ncbi:TetR family transcriptional regulator [Embleya scabrispora]|uniref:TetR family transcriptional regulator n=1 Tax=Embleya scabrispora TaxID=159449 RepID=A0A1T3NQ05_9ACTN|nr:TetR family transcriptional regulator [Embleya scabrispora]
MNKSQGSRTEGRRTPPDSERSQARRAELVAIGRQLFANTSYDALSVDEIASRANVAKGLLYYYFRNKRGYYVAVIEDSVADLVARARSDADQPAADRLRKVLDGYLRFAQGNEAAYRTVVSGGVGFDTDVLTIRERVREEMLTSLAGGAYGRVDLSPIARAALVGWLYCVEGVTLDWLARRELTREEVHHLLVMLLMDTFVTIADLDPAWQPPEAALALHRARTQPE